MQTFDQHLLQHLEAGRITMEEAVHVATSPHDFKLMVAAAGKPKGEGQAQGPGYKPADHSHPASAPGVATVAEPAAPSEQPTQPQAPVAPPVPAAAAPAPSYSTPAPSAPAPGPSGPPPSAPPPGF
jgi:hypothetical protein